MNVFSIKLVLDTSIEEQVWDKFFRTEEVFRPQAAYMIGTALLGQVTTLEPHALSSRDRGNSQTRF